MDDFFQKGLFGVIVIEMKHTHNLNTAENLRFLSADADLQNTFFDYFNDGMGIAESHKHHVKKLELSEDSERALASGNRNPTLRTIQWWHDKWRSLNLGPRTGEGLIKVPT